MNAKDLLLKLTGDGLQLVADGDQLRVSGPLSNEMRALIKEHKPALLTELHRRAEAETARLERAYAVVSRAFTEVMQRRRPPFANEDLADLRGLESEIDRAYASFIQGGGDFEALIQVIGKWRERACEGVKIH